MQNDNSTNSSRKKKNSAFFGLVLILAALLFQSAFSLFVNMQTEGLEQIDIVFRTTITSIFGYIMSMVTTNDYTIKRERKGKAPKPIGFSAESAADDNSPSAISLTNDSNASQTQIPNGIETIPTKNIKLYNMQIGVLTSVCLFCLLILLIVRNFSHLIIPNSSNTVTISMYRDIISGSVGALIGLSRSNS